MLIDWLIREYVKAANHSTKAYGDSWLKIVSAGLLSVVVEMALSG